MSLDSIEMLGSRYQLGPLLGEGGMSTVRAAIDLRLGRDVAIKILRPALSVDASLRKRFEMEARTAAKLSHPNVISIYDTDEQDGVAFLVMERLPGTTIADEIRRGPLSVERVTRVGCEILSALEAAHRENIVHRDIKPSNVLTCADGSTKVADFGIATSIDMTSTMTVNGFLFGTPAYLAPERLDGQSATFSSDIYSVGALLYESLTGRRPFEADSPISLISMIREKPVTPLSELQPGINREITAIVERALEKDPSQRFSSAREMLFALSNVQRNEEIETAFFHIPIDTSRTQPLRADDTVFIQTSIDQTEILHRTPPVANKKLREKARMLWIAGAAAVVLLAIGIGLIVGNGDITPTRPSAPAAPTVTVSSSLPQQLQNSLNGLVRSTNQ